MNFTEDLKRTSQSRYATNDANSGRDEACPEQKRSRINFSPLRSPLESALNKVVNTFGSGGRRGASPGRFGSTPKNKFLTNSSCSNNINNFSVNEYDEDKEALAKMHPEAMEFLKKYFSGYSASQVPTVTFVDYLTKEYSSLWTETQASAIIPEFTQKLLERLGSETVQMSKLCKLVKENGLIGLILGVFRDLKEEHYVGDSKQQTPGVYMSREGPSSRNVNASYAGSVCSAGPMDTSSAPELQNVKNIIQEFTEGLYKSTENEIYAKLNVEMRRLVLKYKETESLLKTVNDRINEDIDKLTYERKKAQLEKTHEAASERLNERIKALQGDLQRERLANNTLKAENEKYASQNRRLTETVDKFQNHLLSKAEEPRESQTKFRPPQISGLTSPSNQQQPIISFAYQSPHPSSTIHTTGANRCTTPIKHQSHIVDNRRPLALMDKQNHVTLNTLNGIVRPTTPLKGGVKPSASPNRMLRVTRNN